MAPRGDLIRSSVRDTPSTGRRRVTFNSLTFIVFFLIVLALHHAPLPWKLKKFNLLIASYVF